MLPATTQQVAGSTSEAINAEIRRTTERRVADLAANPERIDGRLRELDVEWDIERLLEANASTLR